MIKYIPPKILDLSNEKEWSKLLKKEDVQEIKETIEKVITTTKPVSDTAQLQNKNTPMEQKMVMPNFCSMPYWQSVFMPPYNYSNPCPAAKIPHKQYKPRTHSWL